MQEDGKDHINVFSKGTTLLGRKLSNFARTPFILPLAGRFESVEAFWYWWISGGKSQKNTYGFIAKQNGMKYKQVREIPNESLLKAIYKRKLEQNPELKQMFLENQLPFTHYYIYGGKKINTEWEWTGSLWNKLK